MVVFLGVALAATVVGLVLLWPDREGLQGATAAADRIGLVTDRYGAVVESVNTGPCSYATENRPSMCRTIRVTPAGGPSAGETIVFREFNIDQPGFAQSARAGDKIIVGYEPSTSSYFYADRDRRTVLLVLGGLFALVVILLGRARGALALVSMAVTVAVLVVFVAPAVLDGHDPVLVAVVAASAIAFVSLYLTHGVNLASSVALAGTIAALAVTLGISWLFFRLSQFSGLASEESAVLPFVAGSVDLSGLLLAGAVLGSLGALDDVTITEVAVVAELRTQRPQQGFRQLLGSGIRVGREHIGANGEHAAARLPGASMPLLLLFAVSSQSLGMVANSEIVAVEIVRTFCGSIGLVSAVPITTALAAGVLSSRGRRRRLPRGQPAAVSHPDVGPTGRGELPDRPPRWEDFGPDSEA